MRPVIDTGRLGASRLRLAGLGVAAAALLALAPARADAGSMYVHSADRGELAGGRLMLHGVGRNVTWTATNGSVGVARITRAHKRLFSPKTPATGTLHVAGQRGGEELAFRLSKPRYSAARRTVSYRARPLAKRTAAASAAAAGPRRFGAASLSVVPHGSLGSGDNGGNNCAAEFKNDTWFGIAYVSSEKWDTDSWEFPFLTDGFIAGSTSITLPEHGSTTHLSTDGGAWESDGGLWRGCANHTTWTLITDPEDPPTSGVPPANVMIDFNVGWAWGSDDPSLSCVVSDPRFTCRLDRTIGQWDVRDTQRPPR
jgi:hypothetical protein